MTKTNLIVGIVEDDSVLRKSLARLVGEIYGATSVIACASGEEALERLPGAQPQVVLMDLNLPRTPGIECIRKLKDLVPSTQVIVLTVCSDRANAFAAYL